MDRKWLADILFTVERVKFEKMIKEAVKERKERLEEKRSLMIEMRPEFAAAFNNCMSFSSKISFFLLTNYSGERQGLQSDEVLSQAEAHQRRARKCQIGGRRAQKRQAAILADSEEVEGGESRTRGVIRADVTANYSTERKLICCWIKAEAD
jgi:hypothetical protein